MLICLWIDIINTCCVFFQFPKYPKKHFSPGVEEYICTVLCSGSLFMIPLILLYNRLHSLETEQKNQKQQQLMLATQLVKMILKIDDVIINGAYE